jgi:hypothetical protein
MGRRREVKAKKKNQELVGSSLRVFLSHLLGQGYGHGDV